MPLHTKPFFADRDDLLLGGHLLYALEVGRLRMHAADYLEISGWVAQVEQGRRHVVQALPHLEELAIGGTAVGTGLNTHPHFAPRMAEELLAFTGFPFVPAPNKFEALAASDAMVSAHGALKGVAVSLTKIANDVRWLASGPRCGLGELTLPANEPGSSIMPGKVNPTQSEALLMIAARVLGNDVAIGIGGSLGNFELNVYRPLIADAFLQSARLLTDGARSFVDHCIVGIEPNRVHIAELVDRSLMLVTALTPHLGYDAAASIAKKAHSEGTTLRRAALELELCSGDQFDEWVKPEAMLGR